MSQKPLVSHLREDGMQPLEPAYRLLAGAVVAHLNCTKSNNLDWKDRWLARIDALVKDVFPSGGGFFNTGINLDKSDRNKLTLYTSYQHYDQNGYADGYTTHDVVIRADLLHGFTIDVKGRNKNGIKDYISDVFDHAAGLHRGWTGED